MNALPNSHLNSFFFNFNAKLSGKPAKTVIKFMLIQFTVENFRSFKDAQTLSMVAAKGLKRRSAENTFPTETQEKNAPDLLRCAAVFGPNASGKSNLVKALQFVEGMVMESASADAEKPLDLQPFRLSDLTLKKDSTFEVEFIEQGIRYQFGFTANKERITSEWLISYPKARAVALYKRWFDYEKKLDEYQFGNSLEGGRLRKDWASQTGAKTLYISRVVQASSQEFQQLRAPFRWFSRRLRVIPAGHAGANSELTSRMCEDPIGKRKVIDFLNGFDIPITDVEVTKQPLDIAELSRFLAKEAIDLLLSQKRLEEVREAVFLHRSESGEIVRFSASDESSGTMSLYGFAAKWIDILEQDLVLVVDELDSSLHPLVVWELIRKLLETKSKAQIIFTTHDATVMRSKLLRRDQVFFVDPDKGRSSRLYSLYDFQGREDDAIEDRYLQGRYGATPIIAR